MSEIEYFYSAHSAYAYLGSALFLEIARKTGRTIVHKPIDLNIVVPAAGAPGFAQKSDAYRSYYFGREIQRWSEERNAPVMGRPTYHHHDTTLSNCMLIAGVSGGVNIDKLSHALLEAHWRFDADLADVATLERIANTAGYAGAALLDGAQSPAALETYANNSAEAVSRNVLGSPTYVIDGDVFYGQDRLEMVARAIEKPYSTEWSGPQA